MTYSVTMQHTKINLSQLLFYMSTEPLFISIYGNAIVILKTDTMATRGNKTSTMATLIMVTGSEQPQEWSWEQELELQHQTHSRAESALHHATSVPPHVKLCLLLYGYKLMYLDNTLQTCYDSPHNHQITWITLQYCSTGHCDVHLLLELYTVHVCTQHCYKFTLILPLNGSQWCRHH